MMEFGTATILLAVGAGLASVLSPCILPIIPIIVAGADRKDRLRPLILVLGLSISFMAMGATSSLFGALLVGRTRYIELAGATIIMLMGIMVMFNLSVFKQMYRLSNLNFGGDGKLGGLILGMSLGLVWIPCVGPFLSSILTMVGTSGELAKGVILLAFYSLGLGIPMLAIAYSSHLLQNRIKALLRYDTALRFVSGGILVAFGLYSIVAGNIAF